MKHIQFEIDEELHQKIRFRLLYENRRMKEYLQTLVAKDMAEYEADRKKKAKEASK